LPCGSMTIDEASSMAAESSLLLRARPVSEAQWNSSVIIGTKVRGAGGGRRSGLCLGSDRPLQLPAAARKAANVPGGFDTVLVVDFGAQYAQLIARRVRECHVYSEIVPSTMPVEQMLAKRPKAIILSGGPSSVYADGAPPAPAGLFGAGVPVLGICYGFQLMVAGLGGTVERTGAAEYGAAALDTSGGALLRSEEQTSELQSLR